MLIRLSRGARSWRRWKVFSFAYKVGCEFAREFTTIDDYQKNDSRNDV